MATQLEDHHRAQIREIVTGDPDTPVTLETDPSGHGTTGTSEESTETGHAEEKPQQDLAISAEDVVEQLRRHDPLLFELLALRALVSSM